MALKEIETSRFLHYIIWYNYITVPFTGNIDRRYQYKLEIYIALREQAVQKAALTIYFSQKSDAEVLWLIRPQQMAKLGLALKRRKYTKMFHDLDDIVPTYIWYPRTAT